MQTALGVGFDILRRVAGTQMDLWEASNSCRPRPFTIVKSMYEVLLSLPEKLRCIYSADVTKCFENIPVSGDSPDGLPFQLLHSLKAILECGKLGHLQHFIVFLIERIGNCDTCSISDEHNYLI